MTLDAIRAWFDRHKAELLNRGLDEAHAEMDAMVNPLQAPTTKGRARGDKETA